MNTKDTKVAKDAKTLAPTRALFSDTDAQAGLSASRSPESFVSLVSFVTFV